MRYPVIKKFKDKYTGESYNPGKIITLTDENRIANLQMRKLIGECIDKPEPPKTEETPTEQATNDLKEPQEESIEPKHVGGGYYELPDGTRVKGKQAALEAMGGVKID